MSFTLDHIATLFAQRGAEQYSGEPVTQLEHALQTAYLAEQAGADDELVTAALLHDIGHLLNDQGSSPTLQGIDDQHQYFAIPFLRQIFGTGVLDPIRWHVNAKRYLCATQVHYWSSLSMDSQRSLVLQGGVYSTEQAQAFITPVQAKRAVKLRIWDDLAKTPGMWTPSFTHYLNRAVLCSTANLGPKPRAELAQDRA